MKRRFLSQCCFYFSNSLDGVHTFMSKTEVEAIKTAPVCEGYMKHSKIQEMHNVGICYVDMSVVLFRIIVWKEREL